MNVLPGNFSLEKYGLKVRLVNENDAAFIVGLRANPDRTQFMLTLSEDVEQQKIWIQAYKERERAGLDYYLIYSDMSGKPIGLNRISSIDYEQKTGKASSWIAVEGLGYEPLKMVLIRNEIVFNLIGLNSFWGDVHKDNARVLRILDLFGYTFTDLGTGFFKVRVTKEIFKEVCNKSMIKRLMKE